MNSAGDRDETVKAVLDRHARRIVSIPSVVGIAEGEAGGKPCILVLVAEKTEQVLSRIPPELGGWPVVVVETGELRAFANHGEAEPRSSRDG
jgi:hypothetical protein